jgi:hypothetical protein
MKIIYHHLGLGDHISCHGIIRYYCEIEDNVTIFSKKHNYKNIEYMFNDLKNLSILQYNDRQVERFILDNNYIIFI